MLRWCAVASCIQMRSCPQLGMRAASRLMNTACAMLLTAFTSGCLALICLQCPLLAAFTRIHNSEIYRVEMTCGSTGVPKHIKTKTHHGIHVKTKSARNCVQSGMTWRAAGSKLERTKYVLSAGVCSVHAHVTPCQKQSACVRHSHAMHHEHDMHHRGERWKMNLL